MADSDFNAIRPVESLQNIQGLAPATRRQERGRQQKPKKEHRDEPEEKRDDANEPQVHSDDEGPHCIDYCA